MKPVPLRVMSLVAGTEQDSLSLFLCGDVMTARGIDQVLPHPGDPVLHERYVTNAQDYVAIAERANGPILRPVEFTYIWGAALDELQHAKPDFRIINLETSITSSDDFWPGKGIHYRMHPRNIACLTAADIDCCVLANNHVLDWGYDGLEETLAVLERESIAAAGAGPTLAAARAPAILSRGDGRRVLVFSFGLPSSGIDSAWAATGERAGVNLLPDLSADSCRYVGRQVAGHKQPGDIVIASMHWGGNWGYEISQGEQRFARELVDHCGVDVVHGHSSHHPRGIEVYKNKPIIYGCGDLLNDYEGIRGHTEYRPDLALMYFPVFNGSAHLSGFTLTPMQIKRFRLQRPAADDIDWLAAVLDREGSRLGTRVVRERDARLTVKWA
jgi:poly-gamma-glutamate synthesis protein (capsule biosynthesis protein)